MLKKILAVSGKPGLYKLLSQGKNILIVESLIDGKRMPTYNRDKVVSLGEIAIYTDEGETPLGKVFDAIKTKENAAIASIDAKTASDSDLRAYMETILPNYDEDRVRISDIKKLIAWYNLLTNTGNNDFSEEEKTTEETPAEEK